jgi:signal peptidase I
MLGTTDLPPVVRHRGEASPMSSPRPGMWVMEWVAVLVIALLLAVGVRTFVAQMFYIPSGSMLPTLQIGDRIVVDKLSYHLHGVARGDIVVFRRPPLERVDYADLVKRVIGLPGDTVSSTDGRVYIDGRQLSEPWLPDPLPLTSPSPLPQGFSLSHPFVVPAGQYFVMGDNRTDSEDSRYFGPVSGQLIVGKMALIVWPLSNSTWVVALSIVAVVVLILLLLALRGSPPARPGQGTSRRGPPAALGPR